MKRGVKIADALSEQSRYRCSDRGKKYTAIVGSFGIFVFHRYDILKLKKEGVFKEGVDAIKISNACYYNTNMGVSAKSDAIKKQIDKFDEEKKQHLLKRKYRRNHRAYDVAKPCGVREVGVRMCDRLSRKDRSELNWRSCTDCPIYKARIH